MGGQHGGGQHHEQDDESRHSVDDHGSSAGFIGLRTTTHAETFSSFFGITPDRRCRLRAVRPHGGCCGGPVRSGRSGRPSGQIIPQISAKALTDGQPTPWVDRTLARDLTRHRRILARRVRPVDLASRGWPRDRRQLQSMRAACTIVRN